MNRQPWHHASSVLFTATKPLEPEDLSRILKSALAKLSEEERGGIVIDSIDVEHTEPAAGDPADMVTS